MDEAQQTVIDNLHGYEIITNGEEMILDGLIDNLEIHIITDGNLKMIMLGEIQPIRV